MAKYTQILLFLFILTACNSVKNNPSAVKIDINESLTISLSNDFKGPGMFTGDDAVGFKKRRNNGKMNLFFEKGSGVKGAVLEFEKNKLPIKIKEYNRVKSLGNGAVLFAKDLKEMKVLNRSGLVFFLTKSKYKEILKVNYNKSEEKYLLKVLSTISNK